VNGKLIIIDIFYIREGGKGKEIDILYFIERYEVFSTSGTEGKVYL